ncbi:hypothetical protein GCM10022280_00660 [Sphingomonas swuensis]|uniref:Secreted protein n=1 Tax=Sphingomonas swuensis TaxID=977800 RepID=A0ABP7S7U8_9SPHN
MELAVVFAAALIGTPSSSEPLQPVSSTPPQQIVLPIVQPGCERSTDADVVTVCGRKDRRYRIDTSTLQTLRTIEDRDDPGKRPRPNAITQSCSGIGPMANCSGDIPVSAMALRAIGLAVKAIRGEDLRPALRQGPTDYELYQRAKAAEEEKE